MSVEAITIAALIQEGSPKKAFQAGITEEDFQLYDEEWHWLCEQAERRKPINRRTFRLKFPEFDFTPTNERVQDLLEELKTERAFVDLQAAIEESLDELTQDNAAEKAGWLRDRLSEILRMQTPVSDVFMKGDWQEPLDHVRRQRRLHEAGEVMGIPCGLKNFDHHFGGWLPSRVTTFLGRPGDAKSFTLTYFSCQGFLDDRRIGVFSPEMDKYSHWARVHTLLSADPEIQEEVGLRNAFRNRALMTGRGFNEKTYKKFLQYLDTRKGEIILFTKAWRRVKLTPAFIQSRIDDLGLEMVVVDPIYLLKPERRRQLRHEEIGEMMEAMEDIAQTFQIPVLVSNQAHRQMGNKGDAPTKDASFASDAPAQISDHIVGVKHSEEEQRIIMRCTKNRYGANFRCEVRFRPNIGVMEDVTPVTGSYYNGHQEGFDEEIKEALEEAEGASGVQAAKDDEKATEG